MPKITAVITAFDMTTGYGPGVSACWEGIISGKGAIREIDRFSTKSFQAGNGACVSGLKYLGDDSLVMQMLTPLLIKNQGLIPSDCLLILASTTGEIDVLEKQVLKGAGDGKESNLAVLLEKIKTLTRIKAGGMIISSACASASAALGVAASLIQSGKNDCVLVVASDAVTEFVYSGFSTLMALDPDTAKPFDKNRAGLTLGEGAGFILLMSEARLKKEKRKVLGRIAGWAVSSDANHMTGPSRDGSGLKIAIQKAMQKAGISGSDVGCIASHGTGTVYNDSMEMKAYKSIFKKRVVPLYSIKGALGHTMGAAGLIETIIALCALKEKVVPATVGLKEVDPEAKGWASPNARPLKENIILLNNAGFGGVNAVLVLT